MKRSEMIQVLIKSLNEIYTVQSIESMEPEDLASELLDAIEAEGMLPPYICYGKLDPRGYGCKWEPEDEKES